MPFANANYWLNWLTLQGLNESSKIISVTLAQHLIAIFNIGINWARVQFSASEVAHLKQEPISDIHKIGILC